MPLIEDDDPAQLDLGQRSFRNRLLAGRVVPPRNATWPPSCRPAPMRAGGSDGQM